MKVILNYYKLKLLSFFIPGTFDKLLIIEVIELLRELHNFSPAMKKFFIAQLDKDAVNFLRVYEKDIMSWERYFNRNFNIYINSKFLYESTKSF